MPCRPVGGAGIDSPKGSRPEPGIDGEVKLMGVGGACAIGGMDGAAVGLNDPVSPRQRWAFESFTNILPLPSSPR